MLPTYLYSSGKAQKGGRAVVIDAGGTISALLVGL